MKEKKFTASKRSTFVGKNLKIQEGGGKYETLTPEKLEELIKKSFQMSDLSSDLSKV